MELDDTGVAFIFGGREYEYDGLGRRIVSEGQSNVTHDYFNENWQILETRLNDRGFADGQNLWSLRYIDALVRQDKRTIADDGSLDESFGTAGYVKTNFNGNDWGRQLAVQEDGKVVLVGWTDSTVGSNTDLMVVRYNVDGSLDTSFSGDGIFTWDSTGWDYAYAVEVDSAGRIVIADGVAGDTFVPAAPEKPPAICCSATSARRFFTPIPAG